MTAPYCPTGQQKTVFAHDGSAFVTACPGAGKTRTMVERARHLADRTDDKRGVAFLSFTNAAVDELQSRLRLFGLLPSPLFPSFIGTFDRFLWQFFIAPFSIPGCAALPRLVPDKGKWEVKPPFPKAQALPLECFDRKTGVIDAARAGEHGFDTTERKSAAWETCARSIIQSARVKGLVDFDDVRLCVAERLMDTNFAGRIGTALAARFREIVVDEAQDCNPSDLAVVHWLRRSGLAVKVICDPHQSIFKFRGGITNELLDFADDPMPPRDRSRRLTDWLWRRPLAKTAADRDRTTPQDIAERDDYMTSQIAKAELFRRLHTPHDPLILYNIWDAGSAKAVAAAGAKAIATGSWSVAAAQGFHDGEDLPLDDALVVVARITRSVDIPVTVDFEGGYAADPETVSQNVRRLLALGVIGLNFEDQVVDGEGLYSIEDQVARLRAVREVADGLGIPAFINARTDIFLKAEPDVEHATLLNDALERAAAYAEAGADAFFVPGLTDKLLIREICERVALPVNVMMAANPENVSDIAALGISRISFGPNPYKSLITALEREARACF